MWKIIVLAITQCLFLTGGQVCLKFAMLRIDKISLSWLFIREQLTNWWLLASGINMLIATFLWLYIIKHFAFSIAYPMTSIGYLFGMLAAIYIFQEAVPLTRWIGIMMIMGGVILIAK
jgi:undecaprenyl phosphate-alpha-L-ara4N flippase subunit ArnE